MATQRDEIEDIYPLTSMQQGMLLHELSATVPGIYVQQWACTLHGDLDPTILRGAWQALIDRHQALRTLVLWERGGKEPVQVVMSRVAVPWQELDWRGLSAGEHGERLERFVESDRAAGFEFARAPLLRCHLIRLEEESHHFLWTYHHLVLDGWSAALVLKEVFELYDSLRHGARPRLPAVRQYGDFISWRRSQDGRTAEVFWRQELAGYIPVSPPGARAVEDLRPTAGPGTLPTAQAVRQIEIGAAELAELEAAARRARLTLNTFLQGAWAVVLGRLSGAADVVFGTVVSGRPAELEGVSTIVGLFINTLPIRLRPAPGSVVEDFLRDAQAAQARLLQYEQTPLADVLAWSGCRRETPLFESVLSFGTYHVDQVLARRPANLRVTSVWARDSTSYPLHITTSLAASLSLKAVFDPARFEAAEVVRQLAQLAALALAMARSPRARLDGLEALSPAERRQLTAAARGPRISGLDVYPVHLLFEAQAEKNPTAIAVAGKHGSLTFSDLDRRSNQLARHLQSLGVGPEMTVAIVSDRTSDLVISILGVLKAGGAFLPLDPSHPRERLELILKDAGVPVVIAGEWPGGVLPMVPDSAVRLVCPDRDREEIASQGDQPVRVPVDADSLAYVIYTSGSTGKPKGVLVPHGGLTNYLRWCVDTYDVAEGQGAPLHSSIAFDLAITSLFAPLIAGRTVSLLADDDGIGALAAACRPGLDLSFVKMTPAQLTLLAGLASPTTTSGWTRALILGGEALQAEALTAWPVSGTRVFNEYGPTETVVGCCVYEVTGQAPPAGVLPIGRPIANSEIHVVDHDGRLVPAYGAGELWIGGTGVCRGYLRRPDLTAERFVPDPWSGRSGARIYRSGDVGRRRDDGELEFLGRIDQQIKLRGYRIELAEIEAVLAAQPDVAVAAVAAWTDPQAGREGGAELVAYVVPAAGRPLRPEALREALHGSLPEYMVPSRFVALDALPLDVSGKLSRRSLPAPNASRGDVFDSSMIAPATRMEKTLARLWGEVLRGQEVGIHDNFFDLGGNSMLMVQVLARLKKAGIEASMNDLLRHTTIAALARHLGGGTAAERGRPEAVAPWSLPGDRSVAIVGLAGRFPGARDVEAFWANLCAGVESISFFSAEELEHSGIEPGLLAQPGYVAAKGRLDGIEQFDAAFFGFSPREAEITDPQHRLFLECAWEALEVSGHDPQTHPGPIGVFAGASMSGYWFNLYSNPETVEAIGIYQTHISNDKDFLPTRTSYKLGLRGPSVAVQTACSTSLVAVHLACQSLFTGECDMALAGGSSVSPRQVSGYFYQEGGIQSPDGHCRAFDARARGTVPGDGVGVVVLRRLADARRDGDRIYAVIRGSAINNDGAAKAGYTAPSIEGQAEVLARAYAVAGVGPETIGYVEAHGTGTLLGDPIEVAALTEVFRRSTEERTFCALGSVKTNIGHLDTAAGVAGLIKAVLALDRELIPPSLHFEKPNPQINFADTPFYVSRRGMPWPRASRPRRAGVSSFGIGGTNAHVVLEEAPSSAEVPVSQPEPPRPCQVIVVSARSEAAIAAATARLAARLAEPPEADLADVAFTLTVGRRGFEHRRALVCRNLPEAVAMLAEGRGMSGRAVGEPEVVFLFPGQGSQIEDMGRELYELAPVYRSEVDRCSDLLASWLGVSLRDLLYPPPTGRQEEARLESSGALQPALFVVEYALAKLWMSWGVRPAAMIGHSLGEYVAACLAGTFTLPQALGLVALRGRLMAGLTGGAMTAVSVPEEEAVLLLAGTGLSLAAVNGVDRVVVSGPTGEVKALEERLAASGVAYQRLPTRHAFHSAMVEPIVAPFVAAVREAQPSRPRVPYVSNVTGTWIRAGDATDPAYWGRHLRETVRFADGLGEVLREESRVLLEVGPGRALGALARRHPAAGRGRVVAHSLGAADSGVSEAEAVAGALGRLWVAGVNPDWPAFWSGQARRRVVLPTYPFERRRYWIERRRAAPEVASKHPDLADWTYVPYWKPSAPPPAPRWERAVDWLLFLDDAGVGEELGRRLELHGQRVVRVRAGRAFAAGEPLAFTLDPRRPGHFGTLLGELVDREVMPRHIVHLWSLASASACPLDSETFAAAQEGGLLALVYLAQAISRRRLTGQLRLTVVSSSLAAGTDGDGPRPEQATLIGACRVIPQELSNVTCRVIDLAPPGTEPAGSPAELATLLLAELGGEPAEPMVVYRCGRRSVQAFAPVRLEPPSEAGSRLRQRGVYLITGGLGELGLALAEHLARMAQARLILTGRSLLPAREDWPELLRSVGEEHATARRVRRLLALEELGAEVVVECADVADAEQMAGVVARARERFGVLHGVIHAAGVSGTRTFATLEDTGPAECEAHFRAKVHGSLVLARAVEGIDLDFCVLMSSLSAVIGGLGFAAYAAANAFLDSFAQRHNRTSPVPWLSIDWDAWRFPGEGAATGPAVGAELMQLAIRPEEGVEVFQRVLALRSHGQVIVSSGDLETRFEKWVGLGGGQRDDGAPAAVHERPELTSAYVAPATPAEVTIAGLWRQLLGVKRVGRHDDFFELGGDSLLATRLLSMLRRELQVELSLRSIFAAPTVAGIAAAAEGSGQRDDLTALEQVLAAVEVMSEDSLDQLLGGMERLGT